MYDFANSDCTTVAVIAVFSVYFVAGVAGYPHPLLRTDHPQRIAAGRRRTGLQEAPVAGTTCGVLRPAWPSDEALDDPRPHDLRPV
nr:hypothetical protein [Gammaproteobacteria bacterium]